MAELISKIADNKGDAPALVDEHGSTSWAELDDRVNRAVEALRGLGLETHDTVALMSGNRREFFEVFVAAANGGWIVVPVNWHWVAEELAYVSGNAGAKVVLVDDRFLDVAIEARADERTGDVRAWVVLGTPPGADLPEGFISYEELLAAASGEAPQDTSMGGPMFYTSGTTGFPKGVKSTLATTGIPSEVLELISQSFTGMLGLPADGTSLLIGPAYHSAQWVFSVFPLLSGSTIVMRHRFDAQETLDLIDEHGVTNIHLVPTQMIRMLQLSEESRAGFDGSSLTTVFHGAAPCPDHVKRDMLDWWGPVVSEYYGGTEGGFLSLITGEEWLEKPGSLGKPVDNITIQVLDDDGNECAPGTPGQIWFRNEMGTDFSYHDDDEKTAAAHREGFGTLGDVGYIDDDGYLFLSDRKIDMIISGGVNIYPAEIEHVLHDHPAVSDVAVFGVPHDEMGENVAAALELAPGTEGTDELRSELISYCREHLAGYKSPKLIEFHDELPRTMTGKLLKRELRDPHWDDSGRSI
ncbi:MAG: AMP-binding protein [Actinomycetia bacterium]|nr:AMP-binding protein [Actinomycetes bacterium]